MHKSIYPIAQLLLSISVSSLNVFNSTDDKTNGTLKCERIDDYNDLNIEQIEGEWRAVELYMHLSKEGVNQYDTCPVITLWLLDDFPSSTYGPSTENQLFHVQHINAKFRQQYRHLRLLWDESGNTIEYALYFRNDSAGFWQVYSGQNGTLTNLPNYQQFSGSIQVLKAVNDHLLLSFCQQGVGGRPAQMYSVLLSREPGQMARWEIEAAHALLQTKNLSVASRRMVCGNNAASGLLHTFFTTIAALVFVYSSML